MALNNDPDLQVGRIVGIDPGSTTLGFSILEYDLHSFETVRSYARTFNAGKMKLSELDIVNHSERYPSLKCTARHVRYAHSGSENSLKAFMWYDGHTFESKLFTFNILDRVGGGDAFASGLIYAMLHNYKAMDMINFAVASSAIKHTIHGDANITDDVSSIRNLMNMNYDIKR